jgi:hypothetical protein
MCDRYVPQEKHRKVYGTQPGTSRGIPRFEGDCENPPHEQAKLLIVVI